MTRAKLILVLAVAAFAWRITAAQRIRQPSIVGANGSVTLPYAQNDSTGNQWIVYAAGMVRQQGPQPIFAQGDVLTVDGNGCNASSNLAQIDPKTGELVIDNLTFPNCTVTRRILIDKEVGAVRFVDIFHNTQAQPITISVMVQSFVNFGVNSTTLVSDPKHKDRQIGWVAGTGVNRAAVEMYAGPDAGVVPTFNPQGAQQGNNVIQAVLPLTIAPGKSAAFLHLLTSAATMDLGSKFITDMKVSTLMKSIPPDVRKLIVNFHDSGGFVGNYEILRGDVFDVVELRGGDVIKGTLKDDSYKLTTSYGEVNLAADQVIGLINVGQFRPRQLLVTSDGQIFSGSLGKATIGVEMSSGQIVQVPLTQIVRVGYRKRAGEPAEWTLDKPIVLLRSGDRVNIELPTAPIDVDTRYGMLKLNPHAIASIDFQSEETGVHEIYLTDGSKFSGLVDAAQFDINLTSGGINQTVKIPSANIQRLQLAAVPDDADDTAPSLSLVNEDNLVGTLTGVLHLDTAFDTLQLNASEIRRIVHTAADSPDVQVTMWDSTTVGGQLEEPVVACQLGCGAIINAPVSMLAEYNQPLPRPSEAMVEKIKTTAGQLSAEDWKTRETAEANLVAMGLPVVRVLKELRPTEPPEAQERIDAILKQLQASKPGAAAAPAEEPKGGAIVNF